MKWLEVCACLIALSFRLSKSQRGTTEPPPAFGLSHALSEVLGYLKSDVRAHRSHQRTEVVQRANDSKSSFWNGAKDGAKIGDEFRGRLRRRCPSHLGCTSHASTVEIFNGIVMNNVLWLKDVDKETIMQIEALQDFYAGRKDYLPAALAKPGVWTPGPKIRTYKDGDKDAPTACAKIWDTDAFFLYPWESANAYHSLNDNLMSVLASVVLQYVTDFLYEEVVPSSHKTLFLFRNFDSFDPTIIYKALIPLFSADVLPAKEALGRGRGPQCFRRISWGSAAKPFYKDGLATLRRAMHLVFRAVIEHSPGVKLPPRDTTKKTLKVVVISRGAGGSSKGGHKRALHRDSENALLDLLRSRGHQASLCCDFKRMRTIPDIMSKFGDVDICMGLHGAGLANCIFGPPGMTVFEVQTRFHNFGFDSFMKLAHMANGTHVMMDTEGMYSKKSGVVFANTTVTEIVDLLENIRSGDQATLRQTWRNLVLTKGRVRPSPRRNGVSRGAKPSVMPIKFQPSNTKRPPQAREGGPDNRALTETRNGTLSNKSATAPERAPMNSNAVEVQSIWQYKGIFLLTPPFPALQQPFRPSLEALLGPKGAANIRGECERLPYYAFRLYTERQVMKFRDVCDDEKIMRKPSKKPAEVLQQPHLL